MAGRSDREAADAELLRQHRRVLIDLARFASASFDFQSFIDDAVARVASAIEIDHVKLLRYRARHADLLLEAGVGWKPGVVGHAAFATDLASPVGRAFQTGLPVTIEDVSKTEDFRASEVLRNHGIISLLNVPILLDGAAWGVIEVDSSVKRRFSDDTVSFMLAVASIVSLVIRRTDAQTAQQASLAALAKEAQRRELLLREMQHRVKNNFQTILGLISLRRSTAVKEGRALADSISDAIMAISLAHAQLSPERSDEVVDLAGYLSALSATFVIPLGSVTIEVVSDAVSVSIEQAVPIGLIANELVTNSIKHAFGPEGGAIRIELHTSARPGYATLVVSDNGRGISETTDQGSGQTLIRALADQVGGEVSQSSSGGGTTTTVTFVPRTMSSR
jgi:two-component sensor histidine kinase/putative methionine-R-sulfoxide reductase with GAF domain